MGKRQKATPVASTNASSLIILRQPHRTDDQAIRGHRRRIPGLHCRPANHAFEAADLSVRRDGFGTVV